MTQYNGNNVYLDVDGTQIQSWFINVSLSPTIETVDVTAGSGTEHRSRATGLKDTTGSMQIGYDVENVSTILSLLKPGTHTITYGPENNVAGKPKHVQAVIITQAPHTVSVTKEHVIFDVQFEASGAPSTDMFNGGVWS